MKKRNGVLDFLRSRESEGGQAFELFAIFLVLVIMVSLAWAYDWGLSMRNFRSNDVDISELACLNAGIRAEMGENANLWATKIIDSYGVPPEFYTPQEGTGTSLSKGIELNGNEMRVALWGPFDKNFDAFLPQYLSDEIGGRARCIVGLGGPAPLIMELTVDEDDIIPSTSKGSKEYYTGPCTDPIHAHHDYNPANRDEPYCWTWGDEQVLAGDGHIPNEGDVSMSGMILPWIRCEGTPGEAKCTSRVYISPITEGSNVNTHKDMIKEAMCSGVKVPEPHVGVYYGEHSALLAEMDGVSNNVMVQELSKCKQVGSFLVVYVYDGNLYDGNKNFDHAEYQGLTVVRITYMDANTVGVRPVAPVNLADGLFPNIAAVEAAGFVIDTKIVPWE
jgi:hypothetical protein